jgi:hypothetical protein
MMEVPGNHFFLAEEYLEAAEVLFNAPPKLLIGQLSFTNVKPETARGERAVIPFFFCVAQAIELFLKSFLGAKGRGRDTPGWGSHDIVVLLNAAIQNGLDLGQGSQATIRDIGHQQQGIEVRFMDKRGVIYMPPKRQMIESAAELRGAVASTVQPFMRVRGT